MMQILVTSCDSVTYSDASLCIDLEDSRAFSMPRIIGNGDTPSSLCHLVRHLVFLRVNGGIRSGAMACMWTASMRVPQWMPNLRP
jgi:hypothetical protein